MRSASAIGLSIVWVEFDWGTDIYRDRQNCDREDAIGPRTPPQGCNPGDGPNFVDHGRDHAARSSFNGPVRNVRRTKAQGMELRTLAEFTIRNRLLAVEGISQVTVMGGVLKQYQVITSPARLAAQNVTLQQLTEAAAKANVITVAGFLSAAKGNRSFGSAAKVFPSSRLKCRCRLA